MIIRYLAGTLGAMTLLLACQRDVEPEHMEAVSQWSVAICDCASKGASEAKECMAKLKEPKELDQLGDSGRPQYKIESFQSYTRYRSKGDECKAQITAKAGEG